MNRMFLKTVSLVNNYSANLNTGALKPKGANNDFLSIIRTSIKSIGKKADQKHTGLLQTVLPGKNRHHFYLEALRRGLLAKGGTLNKISLKSQDLNILKEFLYKCGFSKKDVESCLKELAENSPRGEINFAAFFNKIEELDPQNNETDRSVTLEFSAVPQLETILRDSGFTLKEIEQTLGSARVDGGDLDLNKLLRILKKREAHQPDTPVSHLIPRLETILRDSGFTLKEIEQTLASARVAGGDLERRINGLVNQAPHGSETGRLSIKDFITALEHITGRVGDGKQATPDVKAAIDHITGRVGDGKQATPDVKAAIDHILEKAVMPKEKNDAVTHIPAFSKHGSIRQASKGKESQRGRVFETERFGSLFVEKSRGGEQGEHDAKPAHLRESVRLSGQPDIGPGSKPEGYDVKTETRVIEILRDITNPDFAESLHALKRNQKPHRDFLPSYLLNQVGKQVSRSILKGQKTITLQLKPPELGVLKIEMDIKGNILKLGMIAENGSVKEILQAGLLQLKGALADQGVKIERFDIQVDEGFSRSLTDSGDGSKEGTKEGKRSIHETDGVRISAADGDDNIEHLSADPRTGTKNDHIHPMLDLTV